MPSISGLKLGQSRRLYVDFVKEATFGTANGAPTHVIDHDGSFPPLARTVDRMWDHKYASGNTTDQPGGHLPIGYTLEATISMWPSLEILAGFLAHAMSGGDAVSGSGAPYTHTLTWETSQNYLNGITVEEHLNGQTVDNDTDVQWLGNCVNRLEWRGGSSGLTTLTIGLMGSGKMGTPATRTDSGLIRAEVTAGSKLITVPKVRISGATASGNGDSAWDGSHAVSATAGTFPALESGFADLMGAVESWGLIVDNGGSRPSEGGTSSSAGTYGAQVFTGDRQCFLELTMKHDANSEQWLRFLEISSTSYQKQLSFIIDIAGEANGYGGWIAIPLASHEENPGGGTGMGPQTYTHRFRALKATDQVFLAAAIANAYATSYDS